MKHKIALYFPIILVILLPLNLYALAPVESLILGSFAENYKESETDPLYYVFMHANNLNAEDLKSLHNELALYRGFYEEGKNLDKACEVPSSMEYLSSVERQQMLRSMMATLQYIALDLSSRAISNYAKYFEFTRDEYTNLVEGMVGNYCSVNLSVISKKELKNNLYIKFDKDNSYVLPSVAKNPLFPKVLQTLLPEKLARENEFKYTVKLFQYACSWGGDPRNAGLLLPFLKDTNIMALVIRQMAGKSIVWDYYKNKNYLKEDHQTQQIWCDTLICRKTTKEYFESHVYHALGGSDVYNDLKRLYCQDVKLLNYLPKENDPRLAKIMNSISFDEENFLNSQLTSLITGVPDFLLNADSFSKGEAIMRASIDQTMYDWAEKSVANFSSELFYEEPLTLELVDRVQYFTRHDARFKLVFDVNLGEFDRINQDVGKIKISFELHVLRSFLRYYRRAFMDLDPRLTNEKELLLKQFKLQITKDVQNAKEKLIIPPWKGDLEAIIANELGEQLALKTNKAMRLDTEEKGFLVIPVEINYSPFALKYINYQFNVVNKH